MTNKAHFRWFAVAVAGAAVALIVNGCTGDTVNNTFSSDAGAVVTADGSIVVGAKCTPSAKECVSPALARVCPADGSGWVSQSCRDGEVCDKGDCKADPNVACIANTGACVSATTALRCRASLQGFEQITCPAGTTCEGEGLCAGACVVGSSICLGTGSIGTCLDGNTFTATACAGATLCVDVSTSPYPVSACTAADCVPDAQGCNTVCGNKSSAAADQTKFTSTCIATPAGFKWVAVGCTGITTCNPTGQSCGSHGEAACASDCTPGQLRCSADKLSTQACGADGKWAGVTACNANPAATALVCQTSPVDPATAICGDAICASGAAGTCDATGLRKCGPDGKLAAAGTACATGICVTTSNTSFGGAFPGVCAAECQAGDERCASSGATSYQTCSASGRWTTPVGCPSADGGAAAATCLDFQTSTQRPGKICGGTCAPSTTRCIAGDGGAGNNAIETCNALGQWSTPAVCTVGACTTGVAGAGAACVAQCIPNATVCVGATKAVPGTPYTGTDAYGACTTQGTLPTSGTTACTGSNVCRKTSLGTVAANVCVECVGPAVTGGNLNGAVDTRCSNAAGTATGSADVQTCATDNTWTAGTLDCVASGKTCTSPVVGSPYLVEACQKENRGHPVTDSYISANSGQSCVTSNRGNLGAPQLCAGIADCCGSMCQRPNGPARCQ